MTTKRTREKVLENQELEAEENQEAISGEQFDEGEEAEGGEPSNKKAKTAETEDEGKGDQEETDNEDDNEMAVETVGVKTRPRRTTRNTKEMKNEDSVDSQSSSGTKGGRKGTRTRSTRSATAAAIKEEADTKEASLPPVDPLEDYPLHVERRQMVNMRCRPLPNIPNGQPEPFFTKINGHKRFLYHPVSNFFPDLKPFCNQNKMLKIFVPAIYITSNHPHVLKRHLWGHDYYTHDSDLVAIIYHQGYIEPSTSPPSDIEGVSIGLRVTTGVEYYPEVLAHNLRSRCWVNHNGYTIMIQKYFKEETLDVELNLPKKAWKRKNKIEFTSLPVNQPSNLPDFPFRFNLTQEPVPKFTLSMIVDDSVNQNGWTSERFNKEVLFVETTEGVRFQICREFDSDEEYCTYQLAKVLNAGMHSRNEMQSGTVLLPLDGVEEIEVVQSNVDWNMICWNPDGFNIGKYYYFISCLFWVDIVVEVDGKSSSSSSGKDGKQENDDDDDGDDSPLVGPDDICESERPIESEVESPIKGKRVTRAAANTEGLDVDVDGEFLDSFLKIPRRGRRRGDNDDDDDEDDDEDEDEEEGEIDSRRRKTETPDSMELE